MSPLEKAAMAVRNTLYLIQKPGREVTHEEIARAVLMAVRSPTTLMLAEGYASQGNDVDDELMLLDAFPAMIDAILNAPPAPGKVEP